MAGLSAARRLTELGLTQFDVFEGADRIGGRIHSIPYRRNFKFTFKYRQESFRFSRKKAL